MKCTCGFDNLAGARFCGNCGLALVPQQQERASDAIPLSETTLSIRSGRPSGRLITVVAAVALAAAAGTWWINRQPTRHGPDNSGLYRIVNDGKIGFMDRSGKTVIAPQFEGTGDFSEGLATVQVGGKIGYIDRKGAVVITPQFDNADSFREGLAPVALGERWGYVDKRGAYVVNAQFEGAGQFFEGRALVRSGGRMGYIDRKGKMVINPQFDSGRDFSEGRAAVRVGELWGYVNEAGEIVINPQFDEAANFSEGLASVSVQSRFGYIDKNGTYVIPPQFDGGGDFSEGSAAVSTGGKWGYIGRDGKYIVNPQFDQAESFADGLGEVLMGQKRGYVDSSGKFVINPQYVQAANFVHGLAVVKEENGREGYIDRDGKYVWEVPKPPQNSDGSGASQTGAPTRENHSAATRRTMADMRSIATAWEARATDTNSYQVDDVLNGELSPSQLNTALSPTYIRAMPRLDGWGMPFMLGVSENGQSYSIRSFGPNRRFDETMRGGTASLDADIVFSEGNFVSYPEGVQP